MHALEKNNRDENATSYSKITKGEEEFACLYEQIIVLSVSTKNLKWLSWSYCEMNLSIHLKSIMLIKDDERVK